MKYYEDSIRRFEIHKFERFVAGQPVLVAMPSKELLRLVLRTWAAKYSFEQLLFWSVK